MVKVDSSTAFTTADGLPDLSEREVGVNAQQYAGALFFGECRDGLAHRDESALVVESVVTVRGGGQRRILDILKGFSGVESELILGEVDGNSEYPGTEGTRSFESMELFKPLQEGFLCEV